MIKSSLITREKLRNCCKSLELRIISIILSNILDLHLYKKLQKHQ